MLPIEATKFYSKRFKDSKGNPQLFKRNGKTKLWKTRPDHYSIPVKRGLREFGYITHENIDNFTWN